MATDRSPRVMGPRGAAALCLLAVLTGCAAGGHPSSEVAAPGPRFDPVMFFSGKTHGSGTLHIAFSKPKSTDVTGFGTVDAGGAITLDQVVVQGDAPPTRRRWRLRPTGADTYAGTLTDATGPVEARVVGNELVIRFTMKHGLAVTQRLFLRPGGREAVNTMNVRKWGILVARLNERIEKRS